jgi:hypothetical protein
MNTAPAGRFTLAVAFAAILPLAACGVVVREDGDGSEKRVDIRSPFGRVTVETNGEMADTGLPVYPGARPLQKGGGNRYEPETANVTIDNSFFGMRVAAAKFESEDAPEAIVEFYRERMKQYGDVTECHGRLDFDRRRRGDRPRCRGTFRSDDVTLGVGTSDHHRIVAIKKRPGHTRFDVVLIESHERG